MNKFRIQILDSLNKPPQTTHLYEVLKSCLNRAPYGKSIDHIDDWFEGVIKSIYYKPNKNMLILLGPQAIGKTQFLRTLLPQKEWFSSHMPEPLFTYCDLMYDKLVIDLSDVQTDTVKSIISRDGYKINQDNTVDKRLASVAYTCNSLPKGFEDRRRSIVVSIQSIDWLRFNEINKKHLWIEIFDKFRYK